MPAMWHAPRQLLSAVVSPVGDRMALDDLGGYLEYKSRGGPRRLFQELNALVRWQDGAPRLGIDEFDGRRLSFYAKLNGVLSLYLDESEPEAQTSLTADRFPSAPTTFSIGFSAAKEQSLSRKTWWRGQGRWGRIWIFPGVGSRGSSRPSWSRRSSITPETRRRHSAR